jgi:hypothetical protein
MILFRISTLLFREQLKREPEKTASKKKTLLSAAHGAGWAFA